MPFKIIRDDITRVSADAIVNTANPEPTYGAGTDKAVYKAAGRVRLLRERRRIGHIAPGEAAVTDAFRLPAKYIIHTVGPEWIDGSHGEFDTLASCYRKSLLLAEKLGCESIAFPLISTGTYGFPKEDALRIALEQIKGFLEDHEIDVTLVVFGNDSYKLASGLTERVEAFIDENYVSGALAQEYGQISASAQMPEHPVFNRPARSPRIIPDRPAPSERRLSSPGARPGRPEPSESADLYNEVFTSGSFAPDASAPSDAYHSAEPEPFCADADFMSAPAKPKRSFNTRPSDASTMPAGAAAAAPEPPAAAPKPAAAFPKPARSLEELMGHVGESFQARLLRMIDLSGMTDPEVYKRANVDRKLFSKIRCSEDYIPKKKTIVALAIAMRLSLDDTKDLLAAAGLLLANNNKFDLIIMFCLDNGIYDIFEVNALLFRFDQPILG